MSIELLWKGLAAGIAIAAPVGPVNVLVISRAIEKSWKSGLVSGLGAALADTFYGSIAGFSITFVIDFLIREKKPIHIAGGLLLMAIGVVYARKKPQPLQSRREEEATHSDFVSTLLLTFTNPTTVLSFLVVLSALGMGDHRPRLSTMVLVGGIFAGSMTWWVILITIGTRLRDKFTEETMVRMNRIAAGAIAGFGAITLAMGLVR